MRKILDALFRHRKPALVIPVLAAAVVYLLFLLFGNAEFPFGNVSKFSTILYTCALSVTTGKSSDFDFSAFLTKDPAGFHSNLLHFARRFYTLKRFQTKKPRCIRSISDFSHLFHILLSFPLSPAQKI